MALFIEATLSSEDGLSTPVSIYQNNDESKVTILPKKKNQLLLFTPNEVHTLHFIEHEQSHTYAIQFEEVKLLDKHTFFDFRILEKSYTLSITKPTPAFYSCGKNKGSMQIISSNKNEMYVQTAELFLDREVTISYKDNQRIRHFYGKIAWFKTEKNRHYYGLFLTKRE